MTKIESFKVSDLVMLRLPFDPNSNERQRYYNTWFRVLFIDNNGTFQGQCERVDFDLERISKGDILTLESKKIQQIYKDGEQFCYGDNVTICECTGLCRNK